MELNEKELNKIAGGRREILKLEDGSFIVVRSNKYERFSSEEAAKEYVDKKNGPPSPQNLHLHHHHHHTSFDSQNHPLTPNID